MLKTRAKTGVFLSALVLLLLHFSYLPYVLKSFAAALNLMGTFELYRAAGCKSKGVPLCISMLLGAAMPFFLPGIPQYRMVVAVVLGLSLVAFFPLAANVDVLTFQTVSVAFGSSFLISLFFSAIPTLRMSQYGLYYVILMVLTSVITEVAAYFVGRAIGKHKLSPKVSPGKTVEGFVGGTTIAYFVILTVGIVFSHQTNTPIRYGVFSCYVLLASVIGQIGDLAMSLIKRAAGIKDFGRLLPGHGSVLDRFDSQLFIAPFTLTFCTFIQHIF